MTQSIQLATFGVWELLIILLIVVLIFGVNKLPMLGDSMGKFIRNFKSGIKGDAKQVESEARRMEEAKAPEQLPAASIQEKVETEAEKVDAPTEPRT